MSEVIDLAGARAIHAEQQIDQRQTVVKAVLDRVAQQNDARCVQSIIIVTIDNSGRTWTYSYRGSDDSTLLVGALEIAKIDIAKDRTFDDVDITEDGDE